MSRNRNQNQLFNDSAINNKVAWWTYYEQLIEIAISRFNWINLPDTVDERFLELMLNTNGYAIFLNDDTIGYLALRAILGGRLDVYDIPTERTGIANNGYQAHRNNTDSVIIYNNRLHTNGAAKLQQFAKDLYELERIINVNAKAQKTPVMLLSDEKQMLTLKNLYLKYDGNQPFIFGNRNDLDPRSSIQALSTGAPYVCDKLYELKTNIWNEAMTFLGIPNVSVNKKERLITDEVTRLQGGTFASRYSALNARQQACTQINKMFGLNLGVEFRQESETDTEKGGDANGNVHSSSTDHSDKYGPEESTTEE